MRTLVGKNLRIAELEAEVARLTADKRAWIDAAERSANDKSGLKNLCEKLRAENAAFKADLSRVQAAGRTLRSEALAHAALAKQHTGQRAVTHNAFAAAYGSSAMEVAFAIGVDSPSEIETEDAITAAVPPLPARAELESEVARLREALIGLVAAVDGMYIEFADREIRVNEAKGKARLALTGGATPPDIGESEVARLTAERNELRAKCDSDYMEYSVHLDKLRRAPTADTARLDWLQRQLREDLAVCVTLASSHLPSLRIWSISLDYLREGTQTVGRTLREAIDKASQQEPTQEEPPA